jgi:hypothetical protein
MYSKTLRGVRELLLPWKSNKYYIFVCVHVQCPGAWARAFACVRVVSLIQHATPMCHIVMSFVALQAPQHFLTLSHKRHDFRKIVIEHKICGLTFSTTLV